MCDLPGTASAQGTVSIEKLSFKVVDAFEPGAAVSGELRIPDSTRGHASLRRAPWTVPGLLGPPGRSAGTSKNFKPSVYQQVTGRPVHILDGDKNDYDDPGSCERFLVELPAQVRLHFSVTIYPGATFAWDSRFSRTYRDFDVNKGQGGTAHVIADPDIANRSREFAAAFFRKHLGAD